MDIKKLKAIQSELKEEVKKEIYNDLPDTVINFLKDEIIEFGLNNVKVRNLSNVTSRNISSWIEQGILKVEPDDKGKINRFTREESIWLYLVSNLRSFGVSLDKIKSIRHELFDEIFPSFSFFRFAIIRTILGSEQTLVVFSDGTTNLLPSKIYNIWINRKVLPPHIHVGFDGLLNDSFTKNSFDFEIEDDSVLENTNSLKILYFIKTGDFETIKIELKKDDVRLIENSKQLISNLELLNLILKENYNKIEIESNGRNFIIQSH